MKRLLLVSLLLLPFAANAGLYENTGFVPGTIWMSPSTYFAGDTVTLYTVLFNGDKTAISGAATFFDNGTKISETPFTFAVDKPVLEISAPWKAAEGEHLISVSLTTKTGGLRYASSSPVRSYVDKDTDADHIGDIADDDDDNDGLSDIDEARLGTDPLNPDTDKDGMPDGQEVSQGTNPRIADPISARIQFASTTLGKIEAATVPIANGIESVRQNLDAWVDSTSDTLKKEIAAQKSVATTTNKLGFSQPSATAKTTSSMPTPFSLFSPRNVLAGLSTINFFTSSQPIFYISVFIVTLLCVRLLFALMNRRHE